MSANHSDPGKLNLFTASRAELEKHLVCDDTLLACEACGAADFRPFATDWHGMKIVSCQNCGLQFVNPRPSFETLSKVVYVERYYTRDGKLQREPLPGEEQALTEGHKRQYRTQIERLEALVVRGPRSLLDVGCGDGTFLQYAADRGWHVAGTEVSERGIQLLRERLGFHAYFGRLHEIVFNTPDWPASRFTAIRLNHVLEHIHHPARDLQVCRRILEPNGILFLSVPNVASLNNRAKSLASRLRLKARPWKHYTTIHHLFFFTADTLERLLERSGFEIVHWETPVLWKAGRSEALHQMYRALLEFPRWANVLDVYARPA